jgi:hypothetical protein
MFCRIVKRKMLKALSVRAPHVSGVTRMLVVPWPSLACALRQT